MSSRALPPTTTAADVALVHGHRGSLTPPLRAMTRASAPTLGPARTVMLAPGPGDGGLQPLYDLLSEALAGGVLVIAGCGAVDAAVFGQIIARAARQVGVVAALVDGAIRDRHLLEAEGVAVFARQEATCGAVGLAHVQAIGAVVTVGDTTVADGDAVLCDEDGAVSLPAAVSERWLAEASALAAAEAIVLAELAAGAPLNLAYRSKRDAISRIRMSARVPAQT